MTPPPEPSARARSLVTKVCRECAKWAHLRKLWDYKDLDAARKELLDYLAMLENPPPVPLDDSPTPQI